jgi:hypothetical protein
MGKKVRMHEIRAHDALLIWSSNKKSLLPEETGILKETYTRETIILLRS